MGVDEIFTVLQDLGFSKYSKGDATAMVAAVDADGNGTIDLDEFIALLRSKKTGKYAKMTFDEELKAAFDIFDADGNKNIDADELSKIMQALGENLTKEEIQFMIKAV